MGINLGAHAFQKKNDETMIEFVSSLYGFLDLNIITVVEGLDYEKDIFPKVYSDFSGRIIAVGESENIVVFIDQNWVMMKYNRPEKIKLWSEKREGLIFSMMNGDTAGVADYLFYSQGKIIRKVSVDGKGICEEREKLIYEKNGLYPPWILDEFSNMSSIKAGWYLVEIRDLLAN